MNILFEGVLAILSAGSRRKPLQLHDMVVNGWNWMEATFEPAHEILALFVLCKLILQTRMRSHPLGLDVWFLVGPFVNCHTSCARRHTGSAETARMRRLAWAFAGYLCDKYHNLMSWRSVRVAERLALPTSDHGVAGSNPAGGEILPDLNGASLYRAFHVHPSIVSKWLKYCWRDVKP